jgi:hypothetical protein
LPGVLGRVLAEINDLVQAIPSGINELRALFSGLVDVGLGRVGNFVALLRLPDFVVDLIE